MPSYAFDTPGPIELYLHSSPVKITQNLYERKRVAAVLYRINMNTILAERVT